MREWGMFGKCKDHLDTVHESYFEHLRFAVWFAAKLIWAGIAVILHALCPAICQTAGSQTVHELNDLLRARAKTHHNPHHD